MLRLELYSIHCHVFKEPIWFHFTHESELQAHWRTSFSPNTSLGTSSSHLSSNYKKYLTSWKLGWRGSVSVYVCFCSCILLYSPTFRDIGHLLLAGNSVHHCKLIQTRPSMWTLMCRPGCVSVCVHVRAFVQLCTPSGNIGTIVRSSARPTDGGKLLAVNLEGSPKILGQQGSAVCVCLRVGRHVHTQKHSILPDRPSASCC